MRWLSRLVCLASLLALSGAVPLRAEEPAFPEKPFYVCARFATTNPSAVTADVKVLGGAQIASDNATTRQTLDAVNSDFWCLDLNSVSNFASDCAFTSYIVRFSPDAANCAVSGGTPSLCVDQLVTSGGLQCMGIGNEETVVYPLVAVPSRGITATVIARGNPSYIKHEVKLDNVTVAFTWYDVFYYTATGLVDRRLRSLSPPSP